MNVYLSGPMTGKPNWNGEAFGAAAARWRSAGHIVFNPNETFGGDKTLPREAYMRVDMFAVSRMDAIALLHGWDRSRGAALEIAVAEACGLAFYDATTMEPIPTPLITLDVR